MIGLAENLVCWDNGGETVDRYTIAYDLPDNPRHYGLIMCSERPHRPHGVWNYDVGTGVARDIPNNADKRLGAPVDFKELPLWVQRFALGSFYDDYKTDAENEARREYHRSICDVLEYGADADLKRVDDLSKAREDYLTIVIDSMGDVSSDRTAQDVTHLLFVMCIPYAVEVDDLNGRLVALMFLEDECRRVANMFWATPHPVALELAARHIAHAHRAARRVLAHA